jgi:hypothetical protein
VGASSKRYEIRVMVDACVFLDELRLCVRRLVEAITDGGMIVPDQLLWTCATLQNIVWEIEDGYTTLCSTGLRSAPEAGVGAAEPQPDADGPGLGG